MPYISCVALSKHCLFQEYLQTVTGTGAYQHVLDGTRHAVKNEDLVRLHSHSIQLLAEASSDIVAKTSSLMKRMTVTTKKPCKLEGHFGAMGKVVDNADINLSNCSFPLPSYAMIARGPFKLTALVRNGRGQALSEAALKVSSIQIWATQVESDFSTAAPGLVPISGYSKGEVLASVQPNLSQSTGLFLELLLDTPCALPEFQNGSLSKDPYMFFPLKTWLLQT